MSQSFYKLVATNISDFFLLILASVNKNDSDSLLIWNLDASSMKTSGIWITQKNLKQQNGYSARILGQIKGKSPTVAWNIWKKKKSTTHL